jgi:hypothetical protein
MGADFFYKCLCWQKDKPLDFEAGRRRAEQIEDLEEQEKILGIITSLEELGLNTDQFYHREGAIISLGPVQMLLAAYQGHGDPDECNSLYRDLSAISDWEIILFLIGFDRVPVEMINQVCNRINDENYLRGLRDAQIGERFDISLDNLTKLSVEDAQVLGRCARNLSLLNLGELDYDIASELANCTGELALEGILKLSPSVAEGLVKHKGTLVLDGLSGLDESVAAILARHCGMLLLRDLEEVDDQVISLLSKHDGELCIQIHELNEKAARHLSKIKSPLYIEGLKQISVDVANALALHHGGMLALNSIEEISIEVADALLKHKGHLSLSGITSLSPQVAEYLGSHNGKIDLDGLVELDHETRRILLRNPNILLPDDEGEVSDEE